MNLAYAIAGMPHASTAVVGLASVQSGDVGLFHAKRDMLDTTPGDGG